MYIFHRKHIRNTHVSLGNKTQTQINNYILNVEMMILHVKHYTVHVIYITVWLYGAPAASFFKKYIEQISKVYIVDKITASRMKYHHWRSKLLSL